MLRCHGVVALLGALLLVAPTTGWAAPAGRQVVSLDGTWQIAQGKNDQVPKTFDRTVPVPGLVDLAQPRFRLVGFEAGNRLREAFWYRRTFRLDGPVPPVAKLKINKAKYGTRVFLNGQLVGDHLPCFTPAVFDVRKYLRGDGRPNELVIRVGAYRTSVPRSIPDGWDFEKYRYIPGIYDSVQLILSGTPHVERVQTVPDIEHGRVRVVARVANAGPAQTVSVRFRVYEADSGRLAGSADSQPVSLGPGQTKTVDVTVPIRNCRLWSPSDPFLYRLEVSTGADTLSVRFGMRTFRFDPKTRRAILNGKPYPLRGTNVCVYRFFEDDARADLPWRKDWVRALHKKFRSMHWEAIRYCIGFPPEIWYDVADELGFLIQDEFPIWYLGPNNRMGVWWPKELTADELVREYTEWMQERWNHPCVVIWDAQNETLSGGETAKAIQRVRKLDLSNRPWDNGWDAPVAPTDMLEAHPYIFSRLWRAKEMKENPIRQLAEPRLPRTFRGREQSLPNAIVINEYGWLWLTRDGQPTSLTHNVYRFLLGPNSTVEQRRDLYAYYLAAMTEYWRSHRRAAGVLHFCGLTYSRPGDKPRPEGGATSDHFLNVAQLTLEPHFERRVRDAFSPVGLMVDLWEEELPGGQERQVDVAVINDLDQPWQGRVRLKLVKGQRCLWQQTQPCRVDSLGRQVLSFTFPVPKTAGRYRLVAELLGYGEEPVRSERRFAVPSGLLKQ